MKRFITILFMVSVFSSLWGQTYKIGDLITNEDGSKGIVFYVTQDRTYGWMVALHDLPTQSWGLSSDIPNLQNLDIPMSLLCETNGYANTGIIRQYHANLGYSQPYGAGSVDYENEWYIPTAGQLMKLCSALSTIANKIIQAGGASFQQRPYFSSTEAYYEQVWTVDFGKTNKDWGGEFSTAAKSQSESVCFRAVKNIKPHQPIPEPGLPDNVIETNCNSPIPNQFHGGQLLHQTSNNINVYSTPLCGDIDDDGIIDIVVAHYTTTENYYRRHWSNELGVYNGNNLSLQNIVSIPQEIYLQYCSLGIVKYPKTDGTLQGAIIAVCNDGKLRSYSRNGQLLNTSDYNVPCDGSPAFADFNNDGYPEVYVGNAVFDAETLKRLCYGPTDGNKGLSHRGSPPSAAYPHRTYYAISYAYNLFGDENLELVCGNTIYKVNIQSRTNPALNSISIIKTVTPPNGFPQDGQVALADLDLDGNIEVFVTNDQTDDCTEDNNFFYAYRPTTEEILFSQQHYCRSTGFPVICNIDNEPHPEILFVDYQYDTSLEKMFCWRYTNQSGLSTRWTYHHNDPSGMTSMVFFDFNNDEIPEIVYRDAYNLNILNGSGKSHITGNDTIACYPLYTYPMYSGTAGEHPIVADVNNDGHAEIIVPGLLEYYSGVNGHGNLLVFGSTNWPAARNVWNQYAYNITNVNNNLTIPTLCYDNASVFTAPDGTVRRPYNNFLQQAGYINQYGEPYNPGGHVEVEHYGEGCETYVFHGITYTESGDYEYMIENPLGCDTLMTVHVRIGDTIHANQYKSVCQPYTWNGITYEETGIYQQTFTAAQGCDSIVTLYLNVGEQIMTNMAISTCDSYTWNGTTYTESGLYEQTFTTAQGCDSIVILDLTIRASSYVSPIFGETIIHYQTNGQFTYTIDPVEGCFGYEWSISNGWTINYSPDAPECTVNINSPGTATLKVRVYTECGVVERDLFINHDARPYIVIYPNPTQGDFKIGLYGMQGEAAIVIYNLLGQFLGRFSVDTDLEGTIVPYSLKEKAAGVYMVVVFNSFDVFSKKVVKSEASDYGLDY